MRKIPFILFALTTATSAFGAVTITFSQFGNNVFISTAGSLDLTELTLFATISSSLPPAIDPSTGLIFLGQGDNSEVKNQYTVTTYPENFGQGGMLPAGGGEIQPALGTDMLAISRSIVAINSDYVFGDSLDAGAVFANTTLEDMGLEAGTYVWTFSNGETITMTVPAVPEPATYATILSATALAFGFFLRTRRDRKTYKART